MGELVDQMCAIVSACVVDATVVCLSCNYHTALDRAFRLQRRVCFFGESTCWHVSAQGCHCYQLRWLLKRLPPSCWQ